MYGISNELGIGKAQVTPNSGNNAMQVAQQINNNYERKIQIDQQRQYNEQRRQQHLVGLVGDALDPKIFDKVFQKKVIDAQAEVLKKVQAGGENMTEADVAVLANEKAQQIAQLDNLFKGGQQAIAASVEKYAKNEEIDKAGLEAIQRKLLLGDLDRWEKGDHNIDFSRDRLGEAKKLHPYGGLTDDNDLTNTKLDPKMDYVKLSDAYSEKNAKGGIDAGSYAVEVPHQFYRVTNLGEDGVVKRGEVPKLEIKGHPSKIVVNNKPLMMLDEDAYGRFSVGEENRMKIDRRIEKKYGKDAFKDLDTLEELRRVEAYNDVEKNIKAPVLKTTNKDVANPAPNISIRNYSGGGENSNNVNDVVGRMSKTIQGDLDNGFNTTRFNKLKADEQTLIKDFINKDLPADEKYTGNDIVVSLNNNGEVEVYKASVLKEGKNAKTLISILPGNFANLKAKQPGVIENRNIVAEGNRGNANQKTDTKPKEDLRKKYNY